MLESCARFPLKSRAPFVAGLSCLVRHTLRLRHHHRPAENSSRWKSKGSNSSNRRRRRRRNNVSSRIGSSPRWFSCPCRRCREFATGELGLEFRVRARRHGPGPLSKRRRRRKEKEKRKRKKMFKRKGPMADVGKGPEIPARGLLWRQRETTTKRLRRKTKLLYPRRTCPSAACLPRGQGLWRRTLLGVPSRQTSSPVCMRFGSSWIR